MHNESRGAFCSILCRFVVAHHVRFDLAGAILGGGRLSNRLPLLVDKTFEFLRCAKRDKVGFMFEINGVAMTTSDRLLQVIKRFGLKRLDCGWVRSGGEHALSVGACEIQEQLD